MNRIKWHFCIKYGKMDRVISLDRMHKSLKSAIFIHQNYKFDLLCISHIIVFFKNNINQINQVKIFMR